MCGFVFAYSQTADRLPDAALLGRMETAIRHRGPDARGHVRYDHAVMEHRRLAIIGLGGGFIPATAVLFAATATAFGRRAILTDLGIGIVLGLVVYLLFAKLLTLSLPVGPIESLF